MPMQILGGLKRCITGFVQVVNRPKMHINIEAPDPPSFTLSPVNQTHSTVKRIFCEVWLRDELKK